MSHFPLDVMVKERTLGVMKYCRRTQRSYYFEVLSPESSRDSLVSPSLPEWIVNKLPAPVPWHCKVPFLIEEGSGLLPDLNQVLGFSVWQTRKELTEWLYGLISSRDCRCRWPQADRAGRPQDPTVSFHLEFLHTQWALLPTGGQSKRKKNLILRLSVKSVHTNDFPDFSDSSGEFTYTHVVFLNRKFIKIVQSISRCLVKSLLKKETQI